MEVQIIKLHKKWESVFTLNETVVMDLENYPITIKSNINGESYNAEELCKCFSNRCSFSDIFKKLGE